MSYVRPFTEADHAPPSESDSSSSSDIIMDSLDYVATIKGLLQANRVRSALSLLKHVPTYLIKRELVSEFLRALHYSCCYTEAYSQFYDWLCYHAGVSFYTIAAYYPNELHIGLLNYFRTLDEYVRALDRRLR